MTSKQTTLYFSNGSSDKVYKASIEYDGTGYLVNFAYGRKGATLRTGTKTQSPVTLDKAEVIYAKLVNSKTSKGYTEQMDGETYTSVDRNDEKSGFSCQLLNPITEEECNELTKSRKYVMQRKYDGVRLTVESNTEVKGINRKGLYVGISSKIADAYKTLMKSTYSRSFLIDGEGMGDSHDVFDILELNGESLRDKPYTERFAILNRLVDQLDTDAIHVVESTEVDFDEMIAIGQSNKWEGVVIKEKDAKYEPNRPASGGTQLKFKFYKTASIVVEKINDKRSVQMSVFNNGKAIPVGNVTIPVNKPIPEVGDILEVRYLYAMPSNALFQPTYEMHREDIPQSDCKIEQLEYKATS